MSKVINAIVVDDENKSRVVLRSLIKEFTPEVKVIGEAASADEAYGVINELNPQLVFLDIQMPGGNGFKLLKKWEELPFDVIFVTSYDQYAINAIKYSALDYLLKPVEIEELKNAVSKAVKNIVKKANSRPQIVALLNNIDPDNKEKKIAVHLNEKVKLIELKRIMYIESDDNYSIITLLSGEHYATPRVLKDIEDTLSDNNDFIRIHKSCIINVNFIRDYTKGEPCVINMQDDKEFEIARRKKQEVLEKLKSRLA